MRIVPNTEKWTKRVVCPGCDETLEVSELDLVVIQETIAGRDTAAIFDFKCSCPSCNKGLYLKDYLPSRIKNKMIDDILSKQDFLDRERMWIDRNDLVMTQ